MANASVGHAQEPSRLELPGMSLLEHLEELRKRIIYSLIAVAVGFMAAWHWAEVIYGYMERPIIAALHANHQSEKLVYTNPTDPFNMYLKIGLIAGIFLASPAVLYQVWMFISPGLYKHEQRYILPFLFVTVGLFLGGGLFGYFVVYPAALDFLLSQGKQFQAMITIGEYTDLFLTVIIGLGVVFEMPTIIFFLALLGVVDWKFLLKHFRIAILGIFTIAAILTPTTDILNMCIFAGPMVVLYFFSVGIAWLVSSKRRRAKKERSA